jgi:ABC-2 type transport system ATP-binding protein
MSGCASPTPRPWSRPQLLGEATRDTDALTLKVPSDGGLHSLKRLLDRLDDESIEVG